MLNVDATNFSCSIELHCRHLFLEVEIKRNFSTVFIKILRLCLTRDSRYRKSFFSRKPFVYGSSRIECFRLYKSATKEGQTAQLYYSFSSFYLRPENKRRFEGRLSGFHLMVGFLLRLKLRALENEAINSIKIISFRFKATRYLLFVYCLRSL